MILLTSDDGAYCHVTSHTRRAPRVWRAREILRTLRGLSRDPCTQLLHPGASIYIQNISTNS